MTTTTLPLATASTTAPVAAPSALALFGTLMRRDGIVLRRELPFFLLRTIVQPLFFVFVFGGLLPRMGFVRRDYGAALLPGIFGVTLGLSAIQSVALPLVQDFGWTREIEDRLLAPIPTWLLALQKVVSGALQGLVSAAAVLPIARLVMGPIAGLTPSHLALVVAVALLGSLTFSAAGLLLGTVINPQQIGLLFSVVLTPTIFFGCAYYPWRGLDAIPWMKYAVLVNPLTYVSEGLRGVLAPGIPHMPLGAACGALVVLTALFGVLGYRSFVRRAFG